MLGLLHHGQPGLRTSPLANPEVPRGTEATWSEATWGWTLHRLYVLGIQIDLAYPDGGTMFASTTPVEPRTAAEHASDAFDAVCNEAM